MGDGGSTAVEPHRCYHTCPLCLHWSPGLLADASRGYMAMGNRGEDGVEDPSGALPEWVQGDL